jgi:hypothetical protein
MQMQEMPVKRNTYEPRRVGSAHGGRWAGPVVASAAAPSTQMTGVETAGRWYVHSESLAAHAAAH